MRSVESGRCLKIKSALLELDIRPAATGFLFVSCVSGSGRQRPLVTELSAFRYRGGEGKMEASATVGCNSEAYCTNRGRPAQPA